MKDGYTINISPRLAELLVKVNVCDLNEYGQKKDDADTLSEWVKIKHKLRELLDEDDAITFDPEPASECLFCTGLLAIISEIMSDEGFADAYGRPDHSNE